VSRLRAVAAVAATVVVVTTLAGCTTTRTVCKDGACVVEFGGGHGETDLTSPSGNEVPLVWRDTEDGTARISLGGEEGTCTEGSTVSLAGADVLCTKVTDDDLELTVR
jgi:hypothetical protein